MEGRKRRVVFAAALFASVFAGVSATPLAAQATGHKTPSPCTFDHASLWTPAGTCTPHAIRYPDGVAGRVKRAIYDSALTFGVPYAVLLRLARCESGLNPNAANGGHFGLYQFLPSTFHQAALQLRTSTGIRAHTYWSALDASYVAGYMFAVGQSPSWTCS